MPTRTEVITALKSRYDAQITGLESANVESAIAKMAIAQLVDASFSGGGSGSISAAEVADGINISTTIGTILSQLTAIIANTNRIPANNQQNEYFNSSQFFASPNTLTSVISLNFATEITFYNEGSVPVYASIVGSSGGTIIIPPLSTYTVKAANLNYMNSVALYTTTALSSLVTINYTSTINLFNGVPD